MSSPVIIKKYPNRRLYDTSTSRYINLEDIAVFVREGRDVQVVDAQNGEDLTRVTLTQIIMDDAKQQPTGLPVELLIGTFVLPDWKVATLKSPAHTSDCRLTQRHIL